MAKKKGGSRRLLFILLAAVVVLVILGVIAAQFVNRGGDGLAVETTSVEVRTITQVVTSSGRVQPEVEIVISPDVSGEVIQLPVKEGQQVRRGELLARIRPDFYSAQVEQAEANVLQGQALKAQRRAEILNAENELNRQKSLFKRQVVSESVYQQAQTQYEIAKAAQEAAQFSVQSAEARLRESKEQLSKTVLYSPMDGTVSKLDIELGERVVGTSQMAGTPMMTIARLDQMELEVDVNENDVVNVQLAQLNIPDRTDAVHVNHPGVGHVYPDARPDVLPGLPEDLARGQVLRLDDPVGDTEGDHPRDHAFHQFVVGLGLESGGVAVCWREYGQHPGAWIGPCDFFHHLLVSE